MASNRNTYQQIETVSVKRDKLIDIASDIEYSKKDLRVFLVLLTQLDGYSVPKTLHSRHKDPLNFKRIDIEAMADLLCMSKKDVKKSINRLHDDGLIEKGSNDTITNGYRFTFLERGDYMKNDIIYLDADEVLGKEVKVSAVSINKTRNTKFLTDKFKSLRKSSINISKKISNVKEDNNDRQ